MAHKKNSTSTGSRRRTDTTRSKNLPESVTPRHTSRFRPNLPCFTSVSAVTAAVTLRHSCDGRSWTPGRLSAEKHLRNMLETRTRLRLYSALSTLRPDDRRRNHATAEDTQGNLEALQGDRFRQGEASESQSGPHSGAEDVEAQAASASGRRGDRCDGENDRGRAASWRLKRTLIRVWNQSDNCTRAGSPGPNVRPRSAFSE